MGEFVYGRAMNQPLMHDASEVPTARKTPLRSEVREEDKWDLGPLFASGQDWQTEFEKVREDHFGMARFKGRLADSAEVLHEALEFEKTIDLRIETLNQYVVLRSSEDSSNAEALDREARFQGLLVQVADAFSYVSPEIQAIPDDRFEAFLCDPMLARWVVPLRKLRRLKAHTLSHPEERLLALGSSAIGGHQETFSQLMNVDMRFGTVTDAVGHETELTQSSFSSMLVRKDRDIREQAFRKFYEEVDGHRFTLASSLANSVRADVFYARARNYPSAIESALFSDDVPVAVYENLISSVRSRLPVLFRYYNLRKKVLGLDEIHHFDTYCPMVGEIETDIEWDEAVDKVLAAVAPLGTEYTVALGHGLREGRWCDRYENRGKRSGAFSYGTYTSPPYIMMNYKRDVFSDVFTLAHEAGHSMHTWYSQRAQEYQNYHYPIFLAEVASTFNELLLTRMLIDDTSDPRMKAYLVSRQLDDLRGTLFRQTMFAEFEREIHRVEEEGGALTVDTFRGIYRELLDTYFGPDFVIDSELELECLRIPHFYSAFYVYKYATGLSAAVALSEQVLTTGDPERYLAFLRSGGSRFPIETLVEAGVDMRTPDPVNATLDLFTKRVDELTQLLA